MEGNYQNKAIRGLDELFQKYRGELGKGSGFTGMVWKAIEPSVPSLLESLDNDSEALKKITVFLEEIVATLKEGEH